MTKCQKTTTRSRFYVVTGAYDIDMRRWVVCAWAAAALSTSGMLTIPLLSNAVCCRQSCAADCPMLPASSQHSQCRRNNAFPIPVQVSS